MQNDDRTRIDFDVIVVGAGLAGLSAARAVREAGHEVVVFEARDRVGGRVHTRPLEGTDVMYNVGAASIAPEWHRNIAQEIERYHLPLNNHAYSLEQFTCYFTGRRYSGPIPKLFHVMLWFSRKKWVAPLARFAPTMPLGLWLFLGVPFRYGREMKKFTQFLIDRSRRLRPGAGFGASELKQFDIPFQDAIAHLDLSPEVREFALASMVQILAGDPKQITLLNALQIVAMLDSNPLAFFAWDRDFVGGNRSLPYAIARDVPDIRLQSPVAAVTQDEHGVTVALRDKRTFRARRAIIACPTATWCNVNFTPPLSAAKREVAQPARWSAVRAIAIVKDLPYSSMGTGYGKGGVFAYAVAERMDGVDIVDLVVRPGEIDINDRQAVEDALQNYYPGVKVLRIDNPNWSNDEFTQQTWNINFAPGQLTRIGGDLIKPEGRLHFCCSDLALGWIGWQDGALEAGKRAGAECAAALVRTQSAPGAPAKRGAMALEVQES